MISTTHPPPPVPSPILVVDWNRIFLHTLFVRCPGERVGFWVTIPFPLPCRPPSSSSLSPLTSSYTTQSVNTSPSRDLIVEGGEGSGKREGRKKGREEGGKTGRVRYRGSQKDRGTENQRKRETTVGEKDGRRQRERPERQTEAESKSRNLGDRQTDRETGRGTEAEGDTHRDRNKETDRERERDKRKEVWTEEEIYPGKETQGLVQKKIEEIQKRERRRERQREGETG